MKIRSWEDADQALAEIGKRREAIAVAKARADAERELIGEIEERLEAFVRDHEEDLQEKSKALPHGRVWLRWSTRLTARSWVKVLENLLAGKHLQYLRVEHEVNKEALNETGAAFLLQIGVRRKSGDAFGYETS